MQPHSFSHSIVFLGNFNPKIFQPAWFAAQNLIGKNEEEGAKVDIISSDITMFSLEWLKIEVLHDRFKASTQQQPYLEALRDLVIGTFSVLRHTPLTMMGINNDMHFRVDSVDIWNEAGHRLAPKEIWTGSLNKPGLVTLTMQDARSDERKGYIRVTVGPSPKVQPGLAFMVNDHFEVVDKKMALGSDELLETLKDVWVSSCKKSEDIAHTLYKRLTE